MVAYQEEIQTLTDNELRREIVRLKKQKNAVILAHYYQEPAIQDLADFVGDSLGLSQQAAATRADIIVFAGVHFMGETAKIINPDKKVLVPDLDASCSLAESCPPAEFRAFIASHPNHEVVTYINCSAEIKAMSDIICTSSNAEKIIRSIAPGRPIIFAPDANLGKFLIQKTGRDMVLWNGSCIVHEAFSVEKILDLHTKYPHAHFIAHPESQPDILKIASFIGSTTALIDYVKKSSATDFIVATEAGILHQMKMQASGKNLIPAPSHQDNSCACSECPYMKMNTVEKLYNALKREQPEIVIQESIRQQALIPLKRMLSLS